MVPNLKFTGGQYILNTHFSPSPIKKSKLVSIKNWIPKNSWSRILRGVGAEKSTYTTKFRER